MSDEFGLMGLETIEDQYLGGNTVRNCSDATSALIDNEIKGMLKDCYAEAKKLLSENRDILDEIATYLYDKETITGKEFMAIFNKCKGIAAEEEVKEETQDQENQET